MRKLFIIGIGAGNPEHLTVQAIKALNLVDVFFFMDKGELKEDLVRLRREICEQSIAGHPYRIVEADDPVRDPAIAAYTARVKHWHHERVLLYEELIERELREDQCGAFLVWGDPSLYDSTLRIIDRITARANIRFDYEVIPGITSVQALAARHRIPLHGVGEPVLFTTGRRLVKGIPDDIENIIVMLDGECAFESIPPQNLDIFWGAYLGMENEVLLSGPLNEMCETIKTTRSRERTAKGWLMDTYLLRRTQAEQPVAVTTTVTLVLGGVRSGKSRYAQQIAERASRIVFVATAEARNDGEMQSKIERHRAGRPSHWLTVEEPVALGHAIRSVPSGTELILIDCLTLFAANLLERFGEKTTADHAEVDALVEALASACCSVVLVSNEVGSGVVPAYALGRRFRDLVGEINQRVAAQADNAILMIAGLPLVLKGELPE